MQGGPWAGRTRRPPTSRDLHSNWSIGLAHLFVTMPFNRFGLLLIELGQLRSGVAIHTQDLIQLGMKREAIAPIGALDEEGHHEDRESRDRIPFKRGRTED